MPSEGRGDSCAIACSVAIASGDKFRLADMRSISPAWIAKLVVELDGGQHAERTAEDQARTEYLARGGFRVLRFWNDDVLLRTEAVLQEILEALKQDSPHPGPLPQAGEGEERGSAD